MITELEPYDRKIIYKRLQEDIRYKMNEILDTVNERVGEATISLDEITKEVEIVRGANHGEN
ncbi:MAG: hypothetical protein COA82_12665 [Alkaliphilus sp.]|nr:hypothetical protein [bacterium AH-315-G05]PHS29473.1 MAG: hypothetical protein COA82_12665 [Alkaliphilus sp.]